MERLQYAIVYDCICEIEGNGQLQEYINIAIIQATHPNLYQIFAGYTTRLHSLSATNRQHIFAQLSDILKQRCIKLLESLNGSEVPSNISMKQLLQEIDTHLKKIPLILVEVSTAKNSIRSNICKLNNLLQKYQVMLDKYSQECLPTKLNFDKLMVSHLCVQTEECRRLDRRNKTLRLYERLGSKEDIEKLKKRRRSLKERSKELAEQISEAKSKLSKYQKCDNRLVGEYKKVKERLEEQKWAKSQLANNFSNLSFSD